MSNRKDISENTAQAKRKLGPVSEREASALKPGASSAWQELREQATLAFDSGLLPRSIDSAQRAVTIAMMGKELGLSPMQALCGIYVVNGMVALRGSLMLRLIYERVPGARISMLTPPENADQECVVEMQRPNGSPQIFRYTLEDARKAGFSNKPIWQQHTSTMLRWAAIRTGARVVFADAIAGCYMEDELPAEASGTEDEPSPRLENDSPVSKEPAPRHWSDPLQRPVTGKQVNRLFAIAHSRRWKRAEIEAALVKWFQKTDPRELTRAEYDKFCNTLLTEEGRAEEPSLAS